MGTSTIQDAITQVARHMSLVDGQVSPYSPDLIVSYLQGAHEFIKDEEDWQEMTLWYNRTLDGSTGKMTQTLPFKDWKKIKRVYHESFQTPLPMLSNYVNPLASTLLLGYRGMSPTEDLTTGDNRYLIMFYPLTLAGRVLLHVERDIEWTNPDAELPIDWWLHVYHASWQYALDDGTNPGQVTKYELLFNRRLSQIRSKEGSRPVLLQPNQVIPNDWFEQDAPYT